MPVQIDLAQQLTDHLVRLAPGQPIDIGETFAHLVTAFTGRVFAADERAIDPVLYRLGQYPGRYSLLDFIPMPHWLRGLDRRQTRVRTRARHPLLDRLIAERKRNDYAGSHDLLWRLANAADERSGHRSVPRTIRDEALTLGATAATPLRIFPWIWYLLALYPGAEARLHAESDAAFGDRSPSPETLLGLTFLRQVVDEAMRLYPPSPVMLRTTLADDVVRERRIPRKSVVVIMPWIVHRHRRLWDDPDRFDPERFAVERAATRPRDAYLPFSRRSPCLLWQRAGDRRDSRRGRGRRAARPLSPRVRPDRRADRVDQPAPALRHPHDGRAAMTTAAGTAFVPAMAPRPARPLSSLQFLRVAAQKSARRLRRRTVWRTRCRTPAFRATAVHRQRSRTDLP